MYKSYSMELGGRTLTVDIGRVAKQANGAALMHYGDTTVLSTATASEKPREGIDFFPLSVEFEEKMYAVGKIPGGFNKREGKASENAVLTARVIDRPMRPLFPKDYRNDCTLNNLVLSVDPECRPELVAMLGSAIATSISDIPFDGRSLMPLVRGEEREAEPEFYITECTWMRKHGWRTPEWKLIVALEPDFHFKPGLELYNLIKYPQENHNVADENPEVVEMLRTRMENFIKMREEQVGRTAPIYRNFLRPEGAFATSQEAYEGKYIGGIAEAVNLQKK